MIALRHAADTSVIYERMATGNCDAIQRHIERQARGRQQRLDKQDEGGKIGKIMVFQARDQDCFDQILKTHQRNVAGRMLEDFHSSGVDEDLEALKAGWANHFKVRPGQPQPQRPLLADLRYSDLDDVEPRSFGLAAQGERAKQRLKGLEQLRHLAESGTLKNQQDSNFAFSEGFLGGDLEKIPQLPRSNGPLRQAGKLLHEGPKESNKSKDRKDLKDWNPHVSDPCAGARGVPDPWAEWEARWSQEFRRLDEMEKNRRQVVDGWQSEREEEWHRRVQAEKERNREASKTTGAKTSKAKTSKEANGPKEATKPPRDPRDPPVPPNLSKHLPTKSAPKYHSFADFSAAWSAFEKKLHLYRGDAAATAASGSRGSGHLSVSDIPWPDGLLSVSGTSSSDTPAEAKKKLRTALLRWHPDKWAPILEHVAPADRAEVISRVKLVTQRLLEEKKANDAK